MGAWGPGLYQDDVTCDVRDEYKNWLKVGASNEEATRNLMNSYMPFSEDDEDEALFWFALADTQWKLGRLLPQVKEEAIRHIKLGKDIERWQDTKYLNKRKSVLEALGKELNMPLPPEKKLQKLVPHKAIWEVGDVLLYKIKAEDYSNKSIRRDNTECCENYKWCDKYILLRVVGIWETNIGSLPMDLYKNEQEIVGIYNWIGAEIPNLEILDKLSFIQPGLPGYGPGVEAFCCPDFDKKSIEEGGYTLIKKDSDYYYESQQLERHRSILWVNSFNINAYFIRMLERAERDGALINETKK